MKKRDKYFLSIKQIYPETQTVVKPITTGMVRDVFIAECPKQKYVCRFLDKAVAQHNLQISKLLTKHNIPVPDVSIYNCGDYWCETYNFIPGKTLHERLLEGFSGEKLDNIYEQIVNMSHRISNIPYHDSINMPVPFISKCLHKTFALLNPSEKRLCHIDLHAKNIILDEHDNLRAIIDLDAFCFEHLSVSYLIMMKDACCHGYNVNKIKNTNIKKPEQQVKIVNTIVKMYHFMVPNCVRKQLLKIRVK